MVEEELQDWSRFVQQVLLVNTSEVLIDPKSLESLTAVDLYTKYDITGTLLLDFVYEYLQLVNKFTVLKETLDQEYQEYLRLKQKFE